MAQSTIFHPYHFSTTEKTQLDRDGHFFLTGLLTPQACDDLTSALSHIQTLAESGDYPQHHPNRYAAECNEYLASLIAHPQMLTLARQILGDDIRLDHCATLNRDGGNRGIGWHSHAYAEKRPELGFVRIFFYVNGFEADDGGLKVVPGSHHYRDPTIYGGLDEDLEAGWLVGKTHLQTDAPLAIEAPAVPPGTVALMWTHAAHAVTPRQPGSDMRWTVVYAYRNPGEPSGARWINEAFEQKPPDGTAGLISLY
ncbi:MAG: phytanoyl-CoA dioxygenase family protein [Chloroflexota bacterium]